MIIKLLIVSGVLIVVTLTTLVIFRRRDDGKVDTIWRSLEATPTHQVFTGTWFRTYRLRPGVTFCMPSGPERFWRLR
jgi:hypothetical protein